MIHFPGNLDFEEGSNQKKDFITQCNLLTTDFEIKIADLGLAKQMDSIEDLTSTMCGTPLYMSPQVLTGARYNYKADIWSIGTMIF